MGERSFVKLEHDGPISILTIDRQDKLNALSAQVVAEIADAVAEVRIRREVRCLIVTGAGEKAFVAGADIRELAEATPLELHQRSLHGQRVFRRLEMSAKPSLAAINGYALGGGLELAMSCTLRVASTEAKLGQPEVRLGLIPGYGGTQRLARLVGRGRALEMLLTGEPVDAAEAFRIGLVNHVVPPSELLEFSRQLMAKILSAGPVAVALAMHVVDGGLNGSLEEGLRIEAAAFGLAASTQDRVEGTRAFLEKRKASFAGR
jgi:enoyl-CoA hydratase